MHISEMTSGMSRGEEAAFDRFHQEYQPRIYRYLYVLLNAREDAVPDVTQETLLRVVRYARPFQCEQAFWDWLTCLARSAVADHGRQLNRWQKLMRMLWDRPPVMTAPPEEGISPLVEQAISLLNDEERALLTAKYSGQTVRDLALQWGESESAIESRLVRLRSRIREQVLQWRRHETE